MQLSRLRRGGTAASVALLCLIVQGAAIGHLLLARHVVCPVHGDLVHEDETHAGESSHAPPDQTQPLTQVLARHDESEAEHQHEHCAVVSSRRDHTVAPVSVQPLPMASEALTSALAVAPHAPATRLIYNLAPKQSPPV